MMGKNEKEVQSPEYMPIGPARAVQRCTWHCCQAPRLAGYLLCESHKKTEEIIKVMPNPIAPKVAK